MMEVQEAKYYENMELLLEISDLKTRKNELYKQYGPGSPDYIKVSLNLELLVKQYLNEKIDRLIRS